MQPSVKSSTETMISAKNWNTIKKAAAVILLLLMVVFLVWVNVSEIKKGGTANRTVAGSTYRNVTYFNDFSLKTMDGEDFSNADFEGYDIIVVNVWEPYCVSCMNEMPVLDELAQEYKDKGLLLISIEGTAFQYPEDIEKGKTNFAAAGASFPALLADEKFTEEVLPYLNNSFPGTWVLDSQGNILDFAAGAKSKDGWQEFFDQYLT